MKLMKYMIVFYFLALPGLAWPVEVDLFVTDYGAEPSSDQQPLADRQLRYANPQQVIIKKANGEQVTYDEPLGVTVDRKGGADPREASIFASKGEYEPFSLLLRPKAALEQVFITSSDLTGDAGRIPKENVEICSVESSGQMERKILLKLGKKWNMPAYSTEHF